MCKIGRRNAAVLPEPKKISLQEKCLFFQPKDQIYQFERMPLSHVEVK